MRAWLIDPLSQPIVRETTFSDDLKTQAIEMLNHFQNLYLPPRIGHKLTNGDLLLVSQEMWRATGWFFKFQGQAFFGRGIVCGPAIDPANRVFTSARLTLIELLYTAGWISSGNLPQRADA
jgi:hypothetical protein